MDEKIFLYYNMENKRRIKLFGNKFVQNNRDKCKIIVDNKESEIIEFYEVGLKKKLI